MSSTKHLSDIFVKSKQITKLIAQNFKVMNNLSTKAAAVEVRNYSGSIIFKKRWITYSSSSVHYTIHYNVIMYRKKKSMLME